jgi:hypothetical protein
MDQTLRVYLLTEEQKFLLEGREVEPGWAFTFYIWCESWVITQDQWEFSSDPELDWVKDLEYRYVEGLDWINLAPGVWDSSQVHTFMPQDPYI